MKNELNEGELLVNRVKLLMRYDMSKTLNENSQYIFEQPDSKFDTPGNKEMIRRGEQEILQRRAKEKAKEEAEQYPNWCSYPDKAVTYPKNPEGAEGDDALLIDPSGIRYCYYSSGKEGGVPIPENSKIIFWDIQGISDFVDMLIKKYPKLYNKNGKEILISNLSSLLPPDSVRGFYVGNTYYTSYITRDSNKQIYESVWYRDIKTKQQYKPQQWNDPRDPYQKFIDEWATWLQVGGFFLSVIAGFFSFGSTWGISTTLLMELGYEIVVGGLVAAREFQKGNNVSAVSSIMFGLLPLLKTRSWFIGISDNAFKEVSEKILQSGLNESSSVRDYVKFYNGLSPDGKKLVSQMFTQDAYTREKMWGAIRTELEDNLPKIVKKATEKLLKKHPNMFVELKTFEKLWVRELTFAVTPLLAGTYLVNHFFGDVLNDQEKQRIKWVYQYTPEKIHKELTHNLLGNPEHIKEIVNSKEFDEIIEKKSDKFVENTENWYRSKIKSAVESPGGKYLGSEPINYESEEIKLEKEGWVKYNDKISDDDIIDSRYLNGTEWVKLSK